MTDTPIIFSGPMVRALLAGRKTMTRRMRWAGRKAADGEGFRESPWARVVPGARLWVRESLTHITSDPVTAQPCSVHCYTASIPSGMTSANPYEANYLFSDDGEPNLKPKGVPSIHMPRWTSRLTLLVTATKIERLQEISPDDAWDEGVERKSRSVRQMWLFGATAEERQGIYKRACVWEFEQLWKSLHGPDAWDANPEVVALTFTVHQHNIDAMEARAA